MLTLGRARRWVKPGVPPRRPPREVKGDNGAICGFAFGREGDEEHELWMPMPRGSSRHGETLAVTFTGRGATVTRKPPSGPPRGSGGSSGGGGGARKKRKKKKNKNKGGAGSGAGTEGASADASESVDS